MKKVKVYLFFVGFFIVFVGAGTSDYNMTNSGTLLGGAIGVCGLLIMALSSEGFRIW